MLLSPTTLNAGRGKGEGVCVREKEISINTGLPIERGGEDESV